MAGTAHESDVHGADGDSGSGGGDCSFMWDDDSQLYYHANSGFYHDPNAGWYYSTRDGLYYRYEDGDYVPWESDEKRESCQHINAILDTGIQDQPGSNTCFADDESADPSPPSEWLEETLINMYLKGYSTEEANVGFSTTLETDGDNYDASGRLLSDSVNGGSHTKELNEVEEDRNIAEDVGEQAESSGSIWGGDAVSCEEIWLAQYGQVIKQEDDNILPFPAIDLWDWRLVDECGKKTSHVSRLVGRLVKQSMKLHPSMPAGGGILKTAPVCEVQLDLVRVATGKIYRLRSPSAEYLSILSTYDSSNPTKDWDFPKLDIETLSISTANVNKSIGASNSMLKCKGSSAGSRQPDSAFGKHCPEYRDRAAERRALHGSSGIAPGEKNFSNDNIDNGDAFFESTCAEETANRTANVPFGAQSYGRRVLESMGWKEGEGIGRTKNGLLQPLQVAGNKGNAGLGWSSERKVM